MLPFELRTVEVEQTIDLSLSDACHATLKHSSKVFNRHKRTEELDHGKDRRPSFMCW